MPAARLFLCIKKKRRSRAGDANVNGDAEDNAEDHAIRSTALQDGYHNRLMCPICNASAELKTVTMTGGRGRGSILSSAQEDSSRPPPPPLPRSAPATGEVSLASVSVLGKAVSKACGEAPAATSSAGATPSHAAVPKKAQKGNRSEAKVAHCLSAESSSGTHPSIAPVSLPASPRGERNPTKGGADGDTVDGGSSLPLLDGRRLRQRHKNGCASALPGSRNPFSEGAARIGTTATDGAESAGGRAEDVQREPIESANGPGDVGCERGIEDASSGARSCGVVIPAFAASANSEKHPVAIVPDKKTYSFSERSAGELVPIGGDEEKKGKNRGGDLAARGASCGGQMTEGASRSPKEDTWRSEERAKARKGGDVHHSGDGDDDASFWCPPFRVSS